MDDALSVEVLQSIKQLLHDSSCLRLGKLLAFDDAIEQLTTTYAIGSN